jgi:hypothetical protein
VTGLHLAKLVEGADVQHRLQRFDPITCGSPTSCADGRALVLFAIGVIESSHAPVPKTPVSPSGFLFGAALLSAIAERTRSNWLIGSSAGHEL